MISEKVLLACLNAISSSTKKVLKRRNHYANALPVIK